MKVDEMYYEQVLDKMEASGVDTWQWADVTFEYCRASASARNRKRDFPILTFFAPH
jgi:hypothetical protein